MSRRDTIIIAVLINTGMLAILFMMAIHTEEESLRGYDITHHFVEEEGTPVSESISKVESTVLVHTTPRDEIDNALKDFSANSQPSRNIAEPVAVQQPLLVQTLPKQAKLSSDAVYVEVTVKRGDCLGKIALANNTSVKEIKEANGMVNERIDVGQILRVPLNTRANQASTETQKVEPIAQNEELYTVRRGDNPWKIAKEFHVKFEDLLIMNNLDEEKARNLKVGDQIRVK